MIPTANPVLKRAIDDLEAQCQRALDASGAYRDACKHVAEQAGIKPAVLSAYVRARVQDKLEEHEQRAAQMQFLFDSFGTEDALPEPPPPPDEPDEPEPDNAGLYDRAGVLTVAGD